MKFFPLNFTMCCKDFIIYSKFLPEEIFDNNNSRRFFTERKNMKFTCVCKNVIIKGPRNKINYNNIIFNDKKKFR